MYCLCSLRFSYIYILSRVIYARFTMFVLALRHYAQFTLKKTQIMLCFLETVNDVE